VFDIKSANYDFDKDPAQTKSKAGKKILAARTRDPTKPGSWMYGVMDDATRRNIMVGWVGTIIEAINANEKKQKGISGNIITLQEPNPGVYVITDIDADFKRPARTFYAEQELYARTKAPVGRAKQRRALRSGAGLIPGNLSVADAINAARVNEPMPQGGDDLGLKFREDDDEEGEEESKRQGGDVGGGGMQFDPSNLAPEEGFPEAPEEPAPWNPYAGWGPQSNYSFLNPSSSSRVFDPLASYSGLGGSSSSSSFPSGF
jgi:hypothetical protein